MGCDCGCDPDYTELITGDRVGQSYHILLDYFLRVFAMHLAVGVLWVHGV